MELLIISSEVPNLENFATYVARRHIGNTYLAISDIKNNSPYGEWQINNISNSVLNLNYYPCGKVINQTYPHGEIKAVISSDDICCADAAMSHSGDAILGIMVPNVGNCAVIASSIFLGSHVPVFTAEIPDNYVKFNNYFSMKSDLLEEVDIISEIMSGNDWNRLGLVIPNEASSFAFQMSGVLSKNNITLYKYIVHEYSNLNEIKRQITSDDIKIISFYSTPTGTREMFEQLSELDSSHVFILFSNIKNYYLDHPDICHECLIGSIYFEPYIPLGDNVNEFTERMYGLNELGALGVDVRYDITGISTVEYRVYDAWMYLAEFASSGLSDIVNFDIRKKGLDDIVHIESGQRRQKYSVMNFSPGMNRVGVYQDNLDLYDDIYYRDGTTVTPDDRTPDYFHKLGSTEMIIGIIIIGITNIILSGIITYIYREKSNRKEIREHGYLLIITSIIGCIILVNSNLAPLMNFAECYIESLFLSISVVIIFGSLYIKNWRIYKIISSGHDKIVNLPDKALLYRLSLLLVPEVILFVVRLAISGSHLEVKFIENTMNEYYESCVHDHIWIIWISIVYKLSLIMGCIMICLLLLKKYAAYHESPYVLFCIVFSLPFSMGLLFLSYFIEENIKLIFYAKLLFTSSISILYSVFILVSILSQNNEKVGSADLPSTGKSNDSAPAVVEVQEYKKNISISDSE